MQGHTLRLVALEQNEKANAFYHFVINSTHGVSFSLALHKLLNFFVFPAVLCLVQYIMVFGRLYIYLHSRGKVLTNCALLFYFSPWCAVVAAR